MFADVVNIQLTAGRGGDGALSFLHEKFREKGGPDGGDGGHGGSIFLVGDRNLNTLYEYKTKRNIKAQNGERGKKRRKKGASGEDLYLKVPVGTVAFDEDTGECLGDIKEDNQVVCVAKGGQGGFGNAHFVSSVRQAPKVSELGEAGDERHIRLEMKMVADAGFVGMPNVGKSTLLSVVSDAKPKIADYPFTTLVPNLGVIEGEKVGLPGVGFVAADIPGLIEGAATGKGLGDDFLRHVERTRVLVHLLDATSESPADDFNDINTELAIFSEKLISKPQIILISKNDVVEISRQKIKEIEEAIKKTKKIKIINKKPLLISSIAHQGLKEAIALIHETIKDEKEKTREAENEEFKVFTIDDIVGDFSWVEKEADGSFTVKGEKIERFGRRTDFANKFAVARLKDIMKKMAIIREIQRKGGKGEVTVSIGDKKFTINIKSNKE